MPGRGDRRSREGLQSGGKGSAAAPVAEIGLRCCIVAQMPLAAVFQASDGRIDIENNSGRYTRPHPRSDHETLESFGP